MSKLKNLKFVLIIISVILAGIYLTFLIDTYTLNTWLKRAFIFCYFVIMSCLVFHLYNKKCKHKYTLIPLVCAIVTVFFGQSIFLPSESEHTIYVQAVETTSEEPEFKEVWLVDVTVDGQKKQLSKLDIGDEVKWSYSGGYDDYCFLPSEEQNETNVFSFTVVGNEITLTFAANTWSGDVRIFDDDGYDKVITLYNEDIENDRLDSTLKITRSYSVFERILYSAGAAVVACYVFKVLFWLVSHFIKKQKLRVKNSTKQ